MAGQIVIEPADGPLKAEIDLPISKSIANRVLILSALSGKLNEFRSADLPDDVRLMVQALSSKEGRINLENAGTAMRFLTAYFSIWDGGTVVLDGNEAMRQRPIKPLVDALRMLGAEIHYEGADGFPPLRIEGKKLTGGKVEIAGSVSSQFISALMLIGSFLENGLKINIIGKAVSASYLQLTADLISGAGGIVQIRPDSIIIQPSTLNPQLSTIETDWSSASYFFALAALRPGSELLLNGLKLESLQGDRRMADIMSEFGVSSKQTENGVLIRSSTNHQTAMFSYDLSSHPDLVQTLVCFHAAMGDEAEYCDIDHLKFKETDRLLALESELSKFGVSLSKTENGWRENGKADWNGQPIRTYGDHRMAMAFSILALNNSGLIIEDPEVVGKSFPKFWEQLGQFT